jgi:hypothetical protein
MLSLIIFVLLTCYFFFSYPCTFILYRYVLEWGVTGGKDALANDDYTYSTGGTDCSSCNPKACGICNASYPTGLVRKGPGDYACELCDAYGKKRFIWPIKHFINGSTTGTYEYTAYCEDSMPQYAGGWLVLLIILVPVTMGCCFLSVVLYADAHDAGAKGVAVGFACCCCLGFALILASTHSIHGMSGWGCPLGEYQGETQCEKCPAGTYGDERGLLECFPCRNGTYQPNSHTTSCLDCIDGIAECETISAPSSTKGGGRNSTTPPVTNTTTPKPTPTPTTTLKQCPKQNGFDLNTETCLCGTNICDESSGLVCNINGEVCSTPCKNGESCCQISFESKASPGCAVSKSEYCIAASKAVFVEGETQEDLVRDDVIIACGAECLELKHSEVQMNILSGINLADMILEIFILLFMGCTMMASLAEGGNGKSNASLVGLGCFVFDVGLQIAALIMAGNTLVALRPFVNSNCLDLAQVQGVDHHNTLNSVISGLDSTLLLGFVELCALVAKFISDGLELWKPQSVKNEEVRSFHNNTDYRNSTYYAVSLGFMLHVAQTIMAIVDYAVFTAPAQAKLSGVFASKFETSSMNWCVQPTNTTLECLVGQDKMGILGYSSAATATLNSRRLGMPQF